MFKPPPVGDAANRILRYRIHPVCFLQDLADEAANDVDMKKTTSSPALVQMLKPHRASTSGRVGFGTFAGGGNAGQAHMTAG